MSSAVTGPIPSIVSSCSIVAVPRLIGPSGAVRCDRGRAGRRLRGHDHLLAVGDLRREVEPVGERGTGPAAGALDRVGDPRSLGQPVDTGVADGPGDVDDQALASLLDFERARLALAACRRVDHAARGSWLDPSAERSQRAPTSSSATAIAP